MISSMSNEKKTTTKKTTTKKNTKSSGTGRSSTTKKSASANKISTTKKTSGTGKISSSGKASNTRKSTNTKRTSTSKKSSNKKGRKSSSGLTTFLLVIFLVLSGIYLYRGYQIKDCFFNGITINNLDVRGMTVEDVEHALSQRAANYQLTITGREGALATISSVDIGYGYVSDGTVQQCFDEQNWLFWGLGYLGGNALKEAREITVPMTYDEAMLQNCMNSWSFMQAEQQRSPEDAYITYENGQYVIISEAAGTALDSSILYENLVQAVNTTASTLSIEDTGAYLSPAVGSDDAILQENVSTLNTYANCTIQHQLPNDEIKGIYPDTLRSWLSTDDEGRYYHDEGTFAYHIENYVLELGNAINSCNKNTVSFYGQDGEWHTISKHATVSWSLDVNGELEKLTKEINSQTSLTREPVYASRARASSGALASTYVEIDLTGQHLWYFENGSIVLECDITSGTATDPERKTPDGLYKIQYKQRDRVLRGDLLSDGTYEYESPVTYWMPFNGGIGLHDASWRDPDVFGGDYYLYNGSHGCINMPTKTAAALYERIEKDCLVACYY